MPRVFIYNVRLLSISAIPKVWAAAHRWAVKGTAGGRQDVIDNK